MITTKITVREPYRTPAIRIFEPRFELSFLESNTDPIDGNDDTYIPW